MTNYPGPCILKIHLNDLAAPAGLVARQRTVIRLEQAEASSSCPLMAIR